MMSRLLASITIVVIITYSWHVEASSLSVYEYSALSETCPLKRGPSGTTHAFLWLEGLYEAANRPFLWRLQNSLSAVCVTAHVEVNPSQAHALPSHKYASGRQSSTIERFGSDSIIQAYWYPSNLSFASATSDSSVRTKPIIFAHACVNPLTNTAVEFEATNSINFTLECSPRSIIWLRALPFVLSCLLFIFAHRIVRSFVCQLSIGTSLAFAFSFFLLLWYIMRRVTFRNAILTALLSAVSGSVGFLGFSLPEQGLWVYAQNTAIIYLAVTSLAAFIYFFVQGPVTNPRWLTVLTVGCRVIAMAAIGLLTNSYETGAFIVIILIVLKGFLTSGGRKMFNVLRELPGTNWCRCRCCTTTKKFLTEEEATRRMVVASARGKVDLARAVRENYYEIVRVLPADIAYTLFEFAFLDGDEVFDSPNTDLESDITVDEEGRRVDPNEIDDDIELERMMLLEARRARLIEQQHRLSRSEQLASRIKSRMFASDPSPNIRRAPRTANHRRHAPRHYSHVDYDEGMDGYGYASPPGEGSFSRYKVH